MKKNYPLLKKIFKYKDFSIIEEKDLIYIMRNAPLVKKEEKERFEKELFSLLTSRVWDWKKTDIDDCTILLYSIYTQNYQILDYLIDNKHYDITSFDLIINKAIHASHRTVGFDMLDKIFSYPQIHKDYLESTILDLLIASLNYSESMFINKSTKALDLLSKIDDKEKLFTLTLYSILQTKIDDTNRISLVIENYPLEVSIKRQAIESIGIKDSPKTSYFFVNPFKLFPSQEIYKKNLDIMNKWKGYYDLSENLENSAFKSKIKAKKV